MKLHRRKTLKADVAKREFPESNFLPYLGHFDSNTIITKKRELMSVIKFEGFSFETADDADLDIKKQIRNTLFKSVATGNYALWFHIIRRKRIAHLDGGFKGAFCCQLNDKWVEKHTSHEAFINELYMTIIYKQDTAGAASFIETFVQNLQARADKDSKDSILRSAHKDLKEIINRLQSSLKDYRPKILGLRETEKGVFSEPLEFLGEILNSGEHTNMLVPSTDASRYLPTHRLYFGKRAMELRGPDGKSRFSAGISIKEYAPATSAGMLDMFLRLPFEFIITQSYVFTNRAAAIASMQLQQNRMASAGDKAISQTQELTIAMDMAQSGYIGFGKHHFSIFVADTDLKKLENQVSLCYAELVNAGISPTREAYGLQALYWAQMPANFDYIARGVVLTTMNLAGLCSLHNYPTGKKSGNHWGPAVTVFDTTSGTPYYFNFHARDVGHSMIIGPTGAGKTVLLNFLMAQAQKFKPRMFFFDKDRGAEIFIRAIGGVYSIIEPGEVTHFNPLQLADTQENRAFLEEWLQAMLMESHRVELTPEERERLTEAVDGNYKLAREDRRLSNIAPFLGLEGPGTLAGRLKMWYGDEPRARLFDNGEDRLDFSKSTVFGFEMGSVLADGKSLGPILLYLFHRIGQALDGSPTIIVLDEAWALIDNEVFAPKIKDWLKVLRKLNAMVIFATQSVEDVSKSRISDTLVQQTATQIFLPNPKGTDEYRRTFLLSEREFMLIRTTDPGSRFFLVKQGSEVVVARIDLSGMSDLIGVLSGRTETVTLLDEIRSQVGDDPDAWLPIFYKRLSETQK